MNDEHLITYTDYDDFGRQDKDWLPYVPADASLNGSYRTNNQETAINAYYTTNYSGELGSTPNPYSLKRFENSPLNRVLEQTAPGESWKAGTIYDGNGHSNGQTIKFGYQTNTTNEVRLYNVTLVLADNTYTPSLVNATTHYLPNELYKSITKDENWKASDGVNKTTEEFKDKQGRVVLKRTYNAGIAHDTYYVYDDFGNLTYVLPPKMEPTTAIVTTINGQLDELGYQYKYDHRNRLVEKKIPGKQWEYIVYNTLDQPILTQDANQKAQNKWLFTKYDVFGRVAYTGEMTRNISRISLQVEVNNAMSNWVTKNTTQTTIDGTTIYYDNGAYPVNDISDILTINYYDNYTFDKVAGNSESSYNITPIDNAKGLATGSKVRVLGTNDWITTVTYYDTKARPIYVYSFNDYLDTTDKIKTKYDFVRVIETYASHDKTGKTTIITQEVFTYDHAGRLKTQTQAINGASTPEVIVDNNYDALGQLIGKGVGGKTSRLQTVDYTYNIRGWLKQINNPTTLGTDLFGFKINYNTVGHGATPLYNGNISETEWKTQSDNSLRWYKYGYDNLNRITSGIDNTADQRYSLQSIAYDKNGNITNLLRKGHVVANPVSGNSTDFGIMDNLTYSYQGNSNKLTIVSDAGNDTFGFKDDQTGTGTDTTIDYTYDVNGNLTTDSNKAITNISYNHLNLPVVINFGSTNKIEYIYDATGVKLQKKVTSGTTITTDYAGNYIYENGNLQFFNQPEGYVEPVNASNYNLGFKYAFQYKDHLGNIRLSYTDADGNGIIVTSEIVEENNYYPFGLKHKGYNNVQSGRDHKFEFQGQEIQVELGLDWISFKWRNHDPAIGRFMCVDPLAEKFPYNSTYAFSENKVIMYNELEGLETGPSYWMANTPSAKQAGVSSTAWQKLYTVNNETESNIAMGTLGASGVGAAISAYGIGAVVTTFVNEVKDEIVSFFTGGASDVIDISKSVKNIVEVGAEKLTKNTDFVVTPDGTTVSTDLNKVEKSYNDAGFNKVDPNNSVYEVPKSDGSGTFYSRLQQGNNPRKTDVDGNRVVNTQNTGNTSNKQYVNPNGSNITGNPTMSERKATGHIQLEKKKD